MSHRHPMSPDDRIADGHRLDKWLWYARFYKTRTLASAAINGGRVHVNAERVKPAHRVRIGDRLSLSLQGIVAEFEIVGLPAKRAVPPPKPNRIISRRRQSAARRAHWREQQRLAQLSRPRSEARPGQARSAPPDAAAARSDLIRLRRLPASG